MIGVIGLFRGSKIVGFSSSVLGIFFKMLIIRIFCFYIVDYWNKICVLCICICIYS